MTKFGNSFLKEKFTQRNDLYHTLLKRWNMNEESFCAKLENWFSNFDTSEEKELGIKIIENIQYISNESFKLKVSSVLSKIKKRKLAFKLEDITLILPDDYRDSAYKTLYDISKRNFEGKSIKLSDLDESKVDDKTIFMAFNDTHGTGNQFISQIKECANYQNVFKNKRLIIAGIIITKSAKDYITNILSEVEGLRLEFVQDDDNLKTIDDIFTRKEYDLIEELGYAIYPDAPLGYGASGLLIAYEYQCPNNTIPIIWAKREDDNYDWKPLFEYCSKPCRNISLDVSSQRISCYTNAKKMVKLSDDELKKVNEILNNWKCGCREHKKIISKLGGWFKNFGEDDIGLAISILEKIQYFSANRTQKVIKQLQHDVIIGQQCDIQRKDIILVLTGGDDENLYHHIYDFMKIWHLSCSQIITLEKLVQHPYLATNKHLIYFYPTRIHQQETFVSKIWTFSKNLPAKSHNILSFMLSEVVKGIIDKDIIGNSPNQSSIIVIQMPLKP